ncbi:MAG: VWA domain-containing protein, partial [Myxococcales bacterium]|nr:VWA domain-containing protein [Myxococcales bacterium]
KPYTHVSREIVQTWIGDALEVDLPLAAIVEELQHGFEPFFLIPDLERRAACERSWRDLLGDRVVCLESPDDTCTVAAGLVALGEGLCSLDELAAKLESSGIDRRRVGRIARALMPFAASCGRDGAPRPALDSKAELPAEAGAESRHRRPGG